MKNFSIAGIFLLCLSVGGLAPCPAQEAPPLIVASAQPADGNWTRVELDVAGEIPTGGFPEGPRVLEVSSRLAGPGEELDEWILRLTDAARRLAREDQVWILDTRPRDEYSPRSHAFLLKAAATAIRGGDPTARIVLSMPQERERLESLFAQDLPAYADGYLGHLDREGETGLEGLVVTRDPSAGLWYEPGPGMERGEAVLRTLARGGKGLLLEGAQEVPSRLLELIPETFSVRGATLTAGQEGAGLRVSRGEGAILFVRFLDLEAFDTTILAWRGEDAPGSHRITVDVAGFGRPLIEDVVSGRLLDPGLVVEETRQGATNFDLPAAQGRVLAIRFAERALVERGARAEEVEVRGTALPPVEKILAAHQAVRAEQNQRLDSYVADSQMDMQFSVAGAGRRADLSVRSRLYYRRGEPLEYENLQYYLNGAPVRSSKIPNLPLVQPEKVQTLPLELTLGKAYEYRLEGKDTVDGRDAYRISFVPTGESTPAYQGEVWIDAGNWRRLRLRAVQLGLEPPILSFEQVERYRDWNGPDGKVYRLPGTVETEQSFTTLGANVSSRVKVRYESYDLNPEDTEGRLAQARQSDSQMLRDTDQGLRYLVKDPDTGERVVQDGTTKTRFWLAGVRYDRSLDFPVPLAGFNFLNFDWRGKGIQTNWFLAGVFNTFTISQPSLGGSKWGASAGFDLALIPLADRGFDREGREREEEDVEALEEEIEFSLWRSIGRFYRLEGELDLTYQNWSGTDDTDDAFRAPEDNITGTFTTSFEFRRAGWNADIWGLYGHRSSWEPWGFASENEDVSDKESYRKWGLTVTKDWRLKAFQSFGVGLEYMDGSDLDRFSQYQAGPFSNVVGGFDGSGLRWEEGAVARIRYGWSVLELAGLDVRFDWARVKNRDVADEFFDNQGISMSGTFTGPKGTVLNFNLGYALHSELFPEAEGDTTLQFLILKLF